MNYDLKPYVLAIRTTERCNAGCFNCSISATPGGADMPLELAINVIEDAANYGIGLLHLTGGEPLNYEYLVELVKKGKEKGMQVEMVTSTYTIPNEDNSYKLPLLVEEGLSRIMLSFDDAHSKVVDIRSFCNFVKVAQNLNLEVYIFVTEDIRANLNTDEIKKFCKFYGVKTENIEWITSIFQYVGRGSSNKASNNNLIMLYSRCPYVHVVPTIRPNGDILLCPCSVFKSTNFVLGNVSVNNFSAIMTEFENSIIYKFLAKYGPQKSLDILEVNHKNIPFDMCQCCEKYLLLTEKSNYRAKLEDYIKCDGIQNLIVDYQGLINPHKRYLDKMFKSMTEI